MGNLKLDGESQVGWGICWEVTNVKWGLSVCVYFPAAVFTGGILVNIWGGDDSHWLIWGDHLKRKVAWHRKGLLLGGWTPRTRKW